MPLFGKSHKKEDPATTRHDPNVSASDADPNLTRYDQPGMNSGPGPGNAPSQHPYPNEANYPGSGNAASQHPYPNQADYPGTGVGDNHAKPSRFGGKVESAIGKMVGSESLRAKGIEKEREARGLNMQSNELAQAESLEREAQMHRDRAMGAGGHNFMESNADRRFNH